MRKAETSMSSSSDPFIDYTQIFPVSHLYVLPLNPLVGVEDTDTNGNTSYAPMC